MAFSGAAARAAKQAVNFVFLIALFSMMLSGHKGVSGAHHRPFHLPSDLPAALTNFTAGHGNFTKFLVDLFLGVGHQVYTFNGTTWINSNVSAVLYDKNDKKVAHHFFLRPPGIGGGVATWAKILPASRVTAAAIVKIPQTGAVPLLLLNATATSGPPISKGGFDKVTHVQRLETRGGLPPSTVNSTAGEVFNSPYRALYAFYHVA